MGCTVSELLDRISSRELSEQAEYERLNPFSASEKVFQWQLAQIAWVIAETNRSEEKHPEPYKVEEFMPKFATDTEEEKQKQPQTWQDQMAMVTMINAALGGAPMKGENDYTPQ